MKTKSETIGSVKTRKSEVTPTKDYDDNLEENTSRVLTRSQTKRLFDNERIKTRKSLTDCKSSPKKKLEKNEPTSVKTPGRRSCVVDHAATTNLNNSARRSRRISGDNVVLGNGLETPLRISGIEFLEKNTVDLESSLEECKSATKNSTKRKRESVSENINQSDLDNLVENDYEENNVVSDSKKPTLDDIMEDDETNEGFSPKHRKSKEETCEASYFEPSPSKNKSLNISSVKSKNKALLSPEKSSLVPLSSIINHESVSENDSSIKGKGNHEKTDNKISSPVKTSLPVLSPDDDNFGDESVQKKFQKESDKEKCEKISKNKKCISPLKSSLNDLSHNVSNSENEHEEKASKESDHKAEKVSPRKSKNKTSLTPVKSSMTVLSLKLSDSNCESTNIKSHKKENKRKSEYKISCSPVPGSSSKITESETEDEEEEFLRKENAEHAGKISPSKHNCEASVLPSKPYGVYISESVNESDYESEDTKTLKKEKHKKSHKKPKNISLSVVKSSHVSESESESDDEYTVGKNNKHEGKSKNKISLSPVKSPGTFNVRESDNDSKDENISGKNRESSNRDVKTAQGTQFSCAIKASVSTVESESDNERDDENPVRENIVNEDMLENSSHDEIVASSSKAFKKKNLERKTVKILDSEILDVFERNQKYNKVDRKTQHEENLCTEFVTSKLRTTDSPKKEKSINSSERQKVKKKHHNEEKKSSQVKKFNNILTKEDISSSETLQLSKNYKQPTYSPIFKKQMKLDEKSESSDSDSDAESRKAIMESAHKRIIQNLSTSESDSKKFARPLSKYYEELTDSDSAPEEMSFNAGRQLEKESMKNAMESISRAKKQKKEKRKQMLEKYKQQKEEKLIRLKEKRASQEDASCSSSEESGYEDDEVAAIFGKSSKDQRVRQEKENVDDPLKSKVKKYPLDDDKTESKDRKDRKRKHERAENIGNLRRLPAEVLEALPDHLMPVKVPRYDQGVLLNDKRKLKKQENTKEKRQEVKTRTDIDYIPLNSYGSTEFGVMPLDTLSKAPKSMAERAAEFRQKMLFGPHVRRGPANAHVVYKQKQKAAGRDKFAR